MKASTKILFCLGMFLALLASCKPRPEGPQPPEIRYGQEACSACGMVIDQPRFAAATLLLNGEVLKFDDLGEMLSYHMDHPEAQVAAWFVHDYPSEEWIRGETAVFVHSESIQTPMGGGIVAFADPAAAKAFAAERNGKIYNLDEMRAQVHMVMHP